VPPSVIEGGGKLVALEFDLKLKEKSDIDLKDSRQGKESILPSSSVRKLRWLT
jgi:hypothetical protein